MAAGLLALLVLSLPIPGARKEAHAAPPAAADSARELFDSAQKLFDEKKFAAAMALFRQAYEVTSSPNAHLMMGRCLLALGRTAEAYDELAGAMREASLRAQTEKKYEGARDAAAAQVALLESKIGKLVIVLGDAGKDARVSLNGTLVPAARLGQPMAVLPGKVEVVAEGLPQGTLRREEQVAAGETRTVLLAPSAAGSAASAAAEPTSALPGPETPAPPPTTGGGVRVAGYVVTALGVAGAVTLGVGVAMSDANYQQLQKECGAARCSDPKYAGVIDSGKTMETIAYVGLAAGGAGLAAGALMIAFGGPVPRGAAQPAIVIAPRLGGLSISGQF
jgi:tetratricopeptide (TPR) repeat protein